MRALFFISILGFSLLFGKENPMPDRRHVLYLMSIKEVEQAIDEYLTLYRHEKKHDFEVLEQMCLTLLEIGSASPNPEDQLLTLFGISLSGSSNLFLTFLDTAIKSPFPEVQAAALQILANVHEDKSNELISIGLKSDFLQIRFETLYYLIHRKTMNSLGQVESLLNLLPPAAKPLFVELYAIHGSFESIQILKQLINDKDPHVRITAILYSALYQRDDLLLNIRSSLTHSDPLIKEAASFALGYLKDLNSAQSLKKIASTSNFPETKLAALISLYRMGHTEAGNEISSLAKEGNLFAIGLLGEISGSDSLLEELMLHKDSNISLNAVISLLARKNPKVLPQLTSLLQTDIEVSGFTPFTSPGHSLIAWKKASPGTLKNTEQKNHLKAVSLHFQEDLLSKSLELTGKNFLELAKTLMESKQTKLLPLLIRLLENEGSKETKDLLIEKAYAPLHPLLRSYCKLALYRMHINDFYRTEFLKWLAHQKNTKMIEFRPMLEGDSSKQKHKGNFTLSPEEISGLFIESFDALASNHDPDGIEFLLESLRDGHTKNRYAFAGLLLKSIH
jgi:HEAT repeat protein